MIYLLSLYNIFRLIQINYNKVYSQLIDVEKKQTMPAIFHNAHHTINQEIIIRDRIGNGRLKR